MEEEDNSLKHLPFKKRFNPPKNNSLPKTMISTFREFFSSPRTIIRGESSNHHDISLIESRKYSTLMKREKKLKVLGLNFAASASTPTPTPTSHVITRIENKRKKLRDIGPIVDMPAALRTSILAMGGYGISLVIQKILTETDMSSNHGRVSLPNDQLIGDLVLTEEEELLLQDDDDKKKKAMAVRIFDSDLNERTISIKKWKMGTVSEKTCCFVTQWNSFVEETQLESNDEIQIWRFRIMRNNGESYDSNLCFVVFKLPMPIEDDIDGE